MLMLLSDGCMTCSCIIYLQNVPKSNAIYEPTAIKNRLHIQRLVPPNMDVAKRRKNRNNNNNNNNDIVVVVEVNFELCAIRHVTGPTSCSIVFFPLSLFSCTEKKTPLHFSNRDFRNNILVLKPRHEILC